MLWLLVALIAFAAALFLVDFGVFRHGKGIPSTKEALAWSGFWLILALSATGIVYQLYEFDWTHLGLLGAESLSGGEAALKFLTGYLLERTIGLDNIILIAVAFTYFELPLTVQRRVLFWAITAALLFRLVLIPLGIALHNAVGWGIYVLGAFVLFSAGRLLVARHDRLRPERSLLARLVCRYFPWRKTEREEAFFVAEDGRWAVTTAGVVLAYALGVDLVFAVDAVPAILVVTSDPVLVICANVFALLGMHSLYFALAALFDKIRYFKVSLVLALFYLGAKALLFHHYVAPQVSLAVLVCLLAVGVAASVLVGGRDPRPLVSPVAAQLGELARLSWAQARRVVVLVVGSTVLLIGILMLVLPGPGLLVIPIGLAILATEFVWASRLLKRVKEEAAKIARSARGRGNRDGG